MSLLNTKTAARYRSIVNMRQVERLTFLQIAERLAVTPARAQQLYKTALRAREMGRWE